MFRTVQNLGCLFFWIKRDYNSKYAVFNSDGLKPLIRNGTLLRRVSGSRFFDKLIAFISGFKVRDFYSERKNTC